MKKIIVLVLFFSLFYTCKNDNKIESEIASIPITIETERFDRFFAEATPADLPKLKQAYPFMFSSKYSDSLWISRMTDSLQQELFSETDLAFKDFNTTEAEIESLFQHVKYYFPEFKTPRVITVTSNVDYRNKVIVTDSLVLISLDTYLGKDHEFYGNFQNYLKQNFTKDQVVVDLALKYAEKYSYQSDKKTLLDEMIYFGKLLYFKDKVLPNKTNAQKIGYTQEQINFAEANESYVWRYFIEKELLYSTDSKLPSRFINPAPFTKFYLELDAESPGRLGQYIGWQIVKAYMENNDVSFQQMLINNPEEIFNNAKFKPRK